MILLVSTLVGGRATKFVHLSKNLFTWRGGSSEEQLRPALSLSSITELVALLLSGRSTPLSAEPVPALGRLSPEGTQSSAQGLFD